MNQAPRPGQSKAPQRPGLSPEAIQALADLWTEILLLDLKRRPPHGLGGLDSGAPSRL